MGPLTVLASKEEVLKVSDEIVWSVIRQCQLTNKTFEDPDFPASNRSIGIVHKKINGEEIGDLPDEIVWLRPKDILTLGRLDSQMNWETWRDPWHFHVKQGAMGDCWLISALKTMPRRKALLEQILPKRAYSLEYGIFQIRLCVDKEWRVLILDDFFPCEYQRFELYAYSTQKQLFVSIIEKAFAKLKGTYGQIHGGDQGYAFELLTGAFCEKHTVSETCDQDALWKMLCHAQSSGFLMGAGTPSLEDATQIRAVGLSPNHAYAVMGISVQHGHRLIQIGNPNSNIGWKGKWSKWPSWSEALTDTLKRLELWDYGLFWMELDDFCQWFTDIIVCHYREGWNEVRIKQVVDKSDKENTIIRLLIDKPCQVSVEVSPKLGKYTSNFINIHRSTSDNRIGECVQSSFYIGNHLTTDSFNLEPGTYFVVFSSFYYKEPTDLIWVIRSDMPISYDTLQMQTDYETIMHESLQQMVLKYGRIEENKEETIVFRTWFKEDATILMAENHKKWNYLMVKCDSSESKNVNCWGAINGEYWQVPPMSRRILVCIKKDRKAVGKPDVNIKLEYRLQWYYLPLELEKNDGLNHPNLPITPA